MHLLQFEGLHGCCGMLNGSMHNAHLFMDWKLELDNVSRMHFNSPATPQLDLADDFDPTASGGRMPWALMRTLIIARPATILQIAVCTAQKLTQL